MRISKKSLIVLGTVIVVGISIYVISPAILQGFTPVATATTLDIKGLKGEIVTSNPSTILCKCPYLIKFTTYKMTDIAAFEVCNGSNCITQNTDMLIDPLKYSNHLETAIQNDNVPWALGDNVDIHIKVTPVHYRGWSSDGGVGYEGSPMQSSWFDLGSSKVTVGS